MRARAVPRDEILMDVLRQLARAEQQRQQHAEALEKGLDFADALHLARGARAAAFRTFDRRLAKRARALRLEPRVELLT